jgi:hypothetical protein
VSDYDPLAEQNLEALDTKIYNTPINPKKPETEKEANKKTERAKREEFFRQRWQQQQAAGLIKAPKKPKGLKGAKPGARHTTSMAQRNASRRNIQRAQLARQARKI